MSDEHHPSSSSLSAPRRAVVSGASSGIGAATVRLLRSHGWETIGVARRADRLEQLATETGTQTIVADLTSPSAVDALREQLEGIGPIHALVNNAGGAIGTDAVALADADDWTRMLDINVIAGQRVVRALLPGLRAGARELGHADIVAVTSTAAYVSYEGGGGYNAAKAALRGMMGALRLELAGEPLRVMQVAPGMVKTEEFSLNRLGGDSSRYDALYEGVERPLLAEDVAEVIVHALELPGHVNLDEIIMRPTAQAAQHKLVRRPLEVLPD